MIRLVLCALLAFVTGIAAPRVVELPGKSPLVTLRFVFTTGAAFDPVGKSGVACLAADLLAKGGAKDLTYKQILDAMYPMATSIRVSCDKEMTTFTGETHADNLDRFYAIFRDMLLSPGWRTDDFQRLRDAAVTSLRVTLRGNNDEELAKEVLYNELYADRPYGHHDAGTVASLQKMTIADLQAFYRQHYTQANLMIGLAGGYSADFLKRVRQDFGVLPAGKPEALDLRTPPAMTHNHATLIQKETRSVAWSLGFPIDVNRGDPDYPALLVMQSWLGQHRNTCRLFTRMREIRGLNYGDYAYIEYFPLGMFRRDPPPNLARRQQIFQIWIRPVEPPNATFALRLAMFELAKMVKDGIPPTEFETTRHFLSKSINILTSTKSAELGYQIDSAWYGIPGYNDYIKGSLAKLTVEDVNRAIRRHLRSDNLQIVGVAADTDKLKSEITGEGATPVHYNSPKATDIVEEDKVVEKYPLHLRAEDVRVIPVSTVFEN